ncbi:MAG TPA: tryptophan synthase subunit alpha [Chitinispirillaceae bacterium]|nr:tryptophan synthase subunit alpha [Chitinispirillaceae bacterium]
MNRYEKTFQQLKQRNEAAFIPFAVAGDPDLKRSESIFKSYIDAGADILEIGYPFSDPIADGPVNQRAGTRAIDAGLDPDSFFSLITKIRKYSTIPFGLLLYANIIEHVGYETFCSRAADAGLDSLLIADLPPEESDKLEAAMKKAGLGRVFIITELTPPTRIKMICDHIDSFIYVVSRLGATGTNSAPSDSIKDTIRKIKAVSDKPCAVGFGISTPDHVRQITATGAEGVIVGSALVSMIEKHMNDINFIEKLKQTVALYKAGTIKNQ